MFARIRRLVRQFLSQSRTINNQPLNKVSLIVIILIDIFILINVFVGLNDISNWHINPSQAYPCYSEWKNYRSQTAQDKDFELVKLAFPPNANSRISFRQTYQEIEANHLGKVSETCLQYADYKDKINNSENQKTIKKIEQQQASINTLEQTNRNIRTQYDSTLLEKIAGQPRDRSINSVSAEKAKQELEQNNRKISTLKNELSTLKNGLLAKPESASLIAFLQDAPKFEDVENGYEQASFWYPSIQLVFQFFFLLPLILIAWFVHRFTERKGYGLLSLMSWHLLVIFFIPLVLKAFEFLQVGALFRFLFEIISALFGGLLFLISYVYILLIPLVGFGIIKLAQKFVLNPKLQATNRVQTSCCVKCAKKIRQHDDYCPYCGYYQYAECPNCHEITYKHLPYCKHCGHSQEANRA